MDDKQKDLISKCINSAREARNAVDAVLQNMELMRDQATGPDEQSDLLIIPRDGILFAPQRPGVRMEGSRGFYIHCSAGRIRRGNDGPGALRAIQRYHIDIRGWNDFGYSFALDNDGNAYQGRGWGVAGAHTKGQNKTWHGVVWLGGADEDDAPSEAAERSMSRLVQEHKRRYGKCELRGHREAPGARTQCPGDGWMKVIEEHRGRAK